MAIFDKILGKKETGRKPAVEAKKEKTAETPKSSADFASGIGILGHPHITEKSVWLSESGTYIFRVHPGANKVEIRRAVEKRYGVGVVRVNIVKAKSKTRMIGRREGHRPGYTKAVVTVRPGNTINFE